MTEEQKKMKKYTNAVERRLNLPWDVRVRVMYDFISSIAARREAGMSDEQIYAELGTPREAAADLNEQMKEFAYVKSPWRWAALAAAVVGAMLLVYDGVMGFWVRMLNRSLNEVGALSIIGGADGPTSVFVATTTGPDETILWLMLTAMGILGFWNLSRCKRK